MERLSPIPNFARIGLMTKRVRVLEESMTMDPLGGMVPGPPTLVAEPLAAIEPAMLSRLQKEATGGGGAVTNVESSHISFWFVPGVTVNHYIEYDYVPYPQPTFPTTPILDAFARPDELELSGNWQTSPWWGDLGGLTLIGQQLAQPIANITYAGSYWTTPFAGDFEVYIRVDALPMPVSSDTGGPLVGFSITTAPPAAATDIAYEVYCYPTNIQLWPVNEEPPWSKQAAVTLAPGDGYGFARLGDHVRVYFRHGRTWRQVIDVIDPTYRDVPLYITVIMQEGIEATVDPPLARLSQFGGGPSALVPPVTRRFDILEVRQVYEDFRLIELLCKERVS
jgi:hypothetical protein